jgi:hypothetical protein
MEWTESYERFQMELTRPWRNCRFFRWYRRLRLHLRNRCHLLPLKWFLSVRNLWYWRSSVAIVHWLPLAVGLLKMVVSRRHLTCVDLLLLLKHLLFVRHFLRQLGRCRDWGRLPSMVLRNGLVAHRITFIACIKAKSLRWLYLDSGIVASILIIVEITWHNYWWCVRRVEGRLFTVTLLFFNRSKCWLLLLSISNGCTF